MRQDVCDTPWKIWTEMRRWLIWPRACLNCALVGVRWGTGWKFYGLPIIQRHRRSQMMFGARLQLRSTARANPLGANHPVILTTWQAGAKLTIGDDFGMTGGTICAAESITIGDRVNVGANSSIIDTDFHPLDPVQRREHPTEARTAPIVIEDDVFIGMNCLILKGVTLGVGCVIGAGSVVTRNVPPSTIAVGNPAKIIGPVRRERTAQ
jgi:acetyltransferase-like isoleucine patch superfamily enzyme